jgi:hypothetical protein
LYLTGLMRLRRLILISRAGVRSGQLTIAQRRGRNRPECPPSLAGSAEGFEPAREARAIARRDAEAVSPRQRPDERDVLNAGAYHRLADGEPGRGRGAAVGGAVRRAVGTETAGLGERSGARR